MSVVTGTSGCDTPNAKSATSSPASEIETCPPRCKPPATPASSSADSRGNTDGIMRSYQIEEAVELGIRPLLTCCSGCGQRPAWCLTFRRLRGLLGCSLLGSGLLRSGLLGGCLLRGGFLRGGCLLRCCFLLGHGKFLLNRAKLRSVFGAGTGLCRRNRYFQNICFQPTNHDRPGVTGVIHSCHSIPNSTWLLELDKLHDHVTHDVRHSKHFKNQRKPVPFIFVKKAKEFFRFQTSCALARHIARDALSSHVKSSTSISPDEIQGETHVTTFVLARSQQYVSTRAYRIARSKNFLKSCMMISARSAFDDHHRQRS